MKQYKYILDKTSKKFNCPKCAKKRYVRYINNESNQYVGSEYGRCDREQKCAHHHYPDNTTSYERKTNLNEVKSKASNIKYEILNKTIQKFEINPFTQYLFKMYKKYEVEEIIKKYHIGTAYYYDGSVIYWQIDNSGNIRTGKIMSYNAETGKRSKNKDGNPKIHWVHSLMKIPEFNLKQCLFGLHLLRNKAKHIAIVESEKTAIIMSLEMPEYTWMATGSFSGFKQDYLEPLKNVNITAYPDKGCYKKWSNTAKELNQKGYNIIVSNIIEKPEYKEGWDLADAFEYEDRNK